MKLTIKQFAEELDTSEDNVRNVMAKLHIDSKRGWLYLDEQDDIRRALNVKVSENNSGKSDENEDFNWGHAAHIGIHILKWFFGG